MTESRCERIAKIALTHDLLIELERRDILAFTAERFTVGRGVAPNSMRLSLTTPESVTTLVDGLESFAQHLQSFG